ncbi:MAG: threonine synthase [Desulfuromonadales bacterium]|nr:threonine synthase [Desulfuromonadales bacterium]
MKYISTRGGITPVKFRDAVMMGLATDGGLLLPETFPLITNETLKSWQNLSYQELAFEIISLFADDIPPNDLKRLINASYSTFENPEITPIIRKNGVYILELFHGPTFAFKDVALQLLGNLFSYLLKESGEKMNILGATSGDTGSAAIYGVRGKANINIFILHPHGKTSKIQELQMTTVPDSNVFNIAAEGTFDHCQNIVKKLFGDIPFKKKYSLGAVNSINWARVLAQVVYYFYAWLKVTKESSKEILFSVPTGNFGDIFAGYVAKRMGLPIKKLILATNENNILTRMVNSGDYSIGKVVSTISPSMDIQVASNFERYLYYLFGESPEKIKAAFDNFGKTGKLEFSEAELAQVQKDFLSLSVTQSETRKTIALFYKETGYILDPHTAVGVNAAIKAKQDGEDIICLATAHPAKFGDAVKQAIGREPDIPAQLKKLESLPQRSEKMAADPEKVRAYIEKHAI